MSHVEVVLHVARRAFWFIVQAIEAPQGGGVLDRPGIRDPRRQEGSLFCQGQIRIARDVIRVDVNRCSA